ncbi:MAG TPA: hypothetical protein VLA61_08205 [Ideonella sp.]|uniref:hypothetical protein n=1 Tax=Ideonella sp. TaxID=1929293 RepID=UPI002C594D46|nr:hypothetical protein [Ideonella sp.]HSI48235.1 hypothetical protein [Ideonella sp.]
MLAKDERRRLVSQVLRQQHTSQAEWWLVQQWLQPVDSIDPGPVADGQAVLTLDDTVRSPTLREGWVRHRDAQGRVLAVITDGEGCD